MPVTYHRGRLFAAARGLFGGAMTGRQVAGLDAIVAAFERLQPEGDTRFLADMLGTAKWETAATMQPIEEYGHGRGRAYGVPTGPWHEVYDGRGDVQLTWLANYRKADAKLKARGVLRADEDLVRTPSLAMRPDVAAAIMIYGMIEGWFTGKRLDDYYNARTDWVGSRRIINGTDHATTIGVIKARFHTALFAARQTAPRPAEPGPAVAPAPRATPEAAEPAPSATRPAPASAAPPPPPVAAPARPAAPLWTRLAGLFRRR